MPARVDKRWGAIGRAAALAAFPADGRKAERDGGRPRRSRRGIPRASGASLSAVPLLCRCLGQRRLPPCAGHDQASAQQGSSLFWGQLHLILDPRVPMRVSR